jgi:hypothetical protein
MKTIEIDGRIGVTAILISAGASVVALLLLRSIALYVICIAMCIFVGQFIRAKRRMPVLRNSGDLAMTAIGTRVTAILEAKDGVVRSFGDGVYAGDFDLPPEAEGFNFGQKNPRIDLDNGKTVWGCESWWGPCEAVRKKIPADWKWETVDIDTYRTANDNRRQSSAESADNGLKK